MIIRKVRDTDMDALVRIYNHYIEATTITFEEDLISSEIMLERVHNIQQSGFPWLVVEMDGHVQGYAYAGSWKPRSAYRYTVEPSIYLAPDIVAKGAGKALYCQLLSILKEQGIKNVLGVIALPNQASVALHESLGFKKVGEFARVGYKFERWVSVGYW